ncbi:MAG: C25 family cysteine peptidase [candidate division WOR-3 bacterium]
MITLSLLLLSALNSLDIQIVNRTENSIQLKIPFADKILEPVNIGFIIAPEYPVYECLETGSNNPVEIGPPVTLKDYNLYPVILNPVAGIKEFNLEIHFSKYQDIKLPHSHARVFKNLILNYEYNPETKPQGLLIITPNSFYNAVLPLADWKEKKGWKVTVAKLSETGNTATAIKNYITNAYYNWNPPPEYVILVGDKDSVPCFTVSSNPTDHPYTTIKGNDFLSDFFIGRLSVANINDLNTVIAKIVNYERNPYTTDTLWFKRTLMVAGNYPDNQMTTPILTKRWVREKFLNSGYYQVDTVFYPPVSNGVTAITNSVNQGVTFVNYRGGIASWSGWDRPSFYNTDVIGLSNGWKLPVITSIVCLTGNFNAEPCFGETWLRAGNPSTPKGAVAFFGASPPTTHSRWNNCLDFGIYRGLLIDSIYYLGPMTYRGKMEVYVNFPLETSPDSGSEFYFNAYNLLGDPSLEVWTDVPRSFIVNHQPTIPVGTNQFSVQVLNSSSQPVEGAMVSLYKKNETKEVEFTGANGIANFQITANTPDTLFVTVTKHNFKPYCGYAMVNNSAVYVGYYNHTISDPGGNNNGEINPGETINLTITLKNFGNSTTATNVNAILTTNDPFITVIDSIKNYGTIAPGATANSSPFVFGVSQNIKNNHTIKFNISISSSQGNWNSVLWLNAKAAEFEYQRCQILDGGNGILEPGETSELTISIKNIGGLIGTNLQGVLRSLNPGVSVIDSNGSFSSIPVGDSATNSGDVFRITASPQLAPGHEIKFLTILSEGSWIRDTVVFSIIIGVVASNKPTGPDRYGYYVYDNTDTGYPEAPTYEWVEIDPDLGGPGTILGLLNDETKTIALPFNFKYYGNNYNRISICSNGYIAMDSTWIADMYNWHIFGAGGPPLLIAPFWDDLDPNATDSSGNICYYYDASNHRFIIEWSRVQHLHNPTAPTPAELQTFEIVLYDPIFYPTQTGDGEILFQYKKINNDDYWHNYATVGIRDYYHINGLEYTYANQYPASAAILENNRAIKFTTDPPDPFPGIEENSNSQSTIRNPKLEVYPNPFKNHCVIKFQIPNPNDQTNSNSQIPNHFAIRNPKSEISLKIYDVAGRAVKSFNPESCILNHASGIIWSGDDDTGRKLPSGIYFIELKTQNYNVVQKVILLE